MNLKKYITATDVLNYNYCTRILYFIHTLKIPQETTKKELKGREKFNEFTKTSKRNKIVKSLPKLRRLYDVYLENEELKILTKVDTILINDEKKEAYPLQAKYGFKPRAIYRSMKEQLMFEAVLIEKELGYKVPFGYIKFLRDGSLVKVNLDPTGQIYESLKNIEEIIASERIPKRTKYKKRCLDCCYRRLCWGDG